MVCSALICPPTNSTLTVMSNCGHSIDDHVAAVLKARPEEYADYCGWNFHGRVWWTGTRWACEVRVYQVVQEIICADSLDELMAAVSNAYGWE